MALLLHLFWVKCVLESWFFSVYKLGYIGFKSEKCQIEVRNFIYLRWETGMTLFNLKKIDNQEKNIINN